MEDSTIIDVGKAWEISPYNGLAYGGIVVLLGLVAWYFKTQAEEKEIYIRSLISKTHDVTDIITEKLTDIKHSKEMNSAQIMGILKGIQSQLLNIK